MMMMMMMTPCSVHERVIVDEVKQWLQLRFDDLRHERTPTRVRVLLC